MSQIPKRPAILKKAKYLMTAKVDAAGVAKSMTSPEKSTENPTEKSPRELYSALFDMLVTKLPKRDEANNESKDELLGAYSDALDDAEEYDPLFPQEGGENIGRRYGCAHDQYFNSTCSCERHDDGYYPRLIIGLLQLLGIVNTLDPKKLATLKDVKMLESESDVKVEPESDPVTEESLKEELALVRGFLRCHSLHVMDMLFCMPVSVVLGDDCPKVFRNTAYDIVLDYETEDEGKDEDEDEDDDDDDDDDEDVAVDQKEVEVRKKIVKTQIEALKQTLATFTW